MTPNEYPVKQTVFLYLKLPFKPGFLECFLLFLESYVFVCFKLIYFWISRQNFSMEGNEIDIALEHIHQNIRAIPEVKKSALMNEYENIITYSIPNKVRCRQTSVVCSKYIWGMWGSVLPQGNLAILTLI